MTVTACRHVALAALSLAAVACSTGPDGSAPPALDASVADASDGGTVSCLICREAGFEGSVEQHVRGVLDQVCGNIDGCHGGGAGNFGIVPGAEFDAMVGVPSFEVPSMLRVAPGDPEHSYVWLKLACDAGPIQGACMPLNAPEPGLASLFHDWIEAGAKAP